MNQANKMTQKKILELENMEIFKKRIIRQFREKSTDNF